jgi:hypothetical protein
MYFVFLTFTINGKITGFGGFGGLLTKKTFIITAVVVVHFLKYASHIYLFPRLLRRRRFVVVVV